MNSVRMCDTREMGFLLKIDVIQIDEPARARQFVKNGFDNLRPTLDAPSTAMPAPVRYDIARCNQLYARGSIVAAREAVRPSLRAKTTRNNLSMTLQEPR